MKRNWYEARLIGRAAAGGQAGGGDDLRVTLVLAAGEVLSARVRRPWMLVCLSGRLWATQESSGDDHLLEAGGRWSCGGMGKLVVQALKPSTVRLERPRPARAGAGSTLRPLVQPG